MQKKDLSIYIHIPFCIKKCDYCDFLSAASSPEERAYYTRVLQKEIRAFEPLSYIYKVKSIFFGGGTPSVLEIPHFNRITQQLFDSFDISDDAEITVECNPGTLNEEKLKAYRSAGVNRLSLGLQSADENELRLLGRIHSFEEFRSNFALARRLGFDNINVDLMSGIPTQTMDSWKETLKKTVELAPDHISAYSLIIEENTPFYERYLGARGRSALPDEELDRKMYHYTHSYLSENGYERYEISNYSKPGRQCRHNTVYWTMKSYLGLGLGASSYLDRKRFSNPRSFDGYRDFVKDAYRSFKTCEPQSLKETMEEFMFLGLRMDRGVFTGEFERTFGKSFDELYGGVTKRLEDTGFITRKEGVIKLTSKGIDVSNRVLANYLLP